MPAKRRLPRGQLRKQRRCGTVGDASIRGRQTSIGSTRILQIVQWEWFKKEFVLSINRLLLSRHTLMHANVQAAQRGAKAAVMTQPEADDPLAHKYGDAQLVASQAVSGRTWTRVEQLDESFKDKEVGHWLWLDGPPPRQFGWDVVNSHGSMDHHTSCRS
jgi:hypothetical protein